MRQATTADIQAAFDKVLKKRGTQDSRQVTLPFVRRSRTSKLAADSMTPFAGPIGKRIFDQIKGRGPLGLTCDEAEQVCKLTHQTASARIRRLSQLYKIRGSGRTRPTRSGRQAQVYIVPEEPEGLQIGNP